MTLVMAGFWEDVTWSECPSCGFDSLGTMPLYLMGEQGVSVGGTYRFCGRREESA